jgi:hypothetical protein
MVPIDLGGGAVDDSASTVSGLTTTVDDLAVLPPRFTGANRLVCLFTPGATFFPSEGSDMII